MPPKVGGAVFAINCLKSAGLAKAVAVVGDTLAKQVTIAEEQAKNQAEIFLKVQDSSEKVFRKIKIAGKYFQKVFCI